MSIHVSSGSGTLRRVVLSCDAAGCPVQLEPPAAERWRSDTDARSWARDQAVGWTSDPVRQTDYCPAHAGLSTAPPADVATPGPTATAQDEQAVRLRARLADDDGSTGHVVLTAAEATVVARLLDELAGVNRDGELGRLAHELSVVIDSQLRATEPGEGYR